MKIECYISHGCGSEAALRLNIDEALRLEGNVDAQVIIHQVQEAVARALGFGGSPTVLIDGRDIDPMPTAQGFG